MSVLRFLLLAITTPFMWLRCYGLGGHSWTRQDFGYAYRDHERYYCERCFVYRGEGQGRG